MESLTHDPACSREVDPAEILERIDMSTNSAAVLIASCTTVATDEPFTSVFARDDPPSDRVTVPSVSPTTLAEAVAPVTLPSTEFKTPAQWKDMVGYDVRFGATVTEPYQSLSAVTRNDIGKHIIFIAPSRLSLDWHQDMDHSGSHCVQYALSNIDEDGTVVLVDEEGRVTSENRKFGKWVTYESFAAVRTYRTTPDWQALPAQFNHVLYYDRDPKKLEVAQRFYDATLAFQALFDTETKTTTPI